jgi:hypothetical protein
MNLLLIGRNIVAPRVWVIKKQFISSPDFLMGIFHFGSPSIGNATISRLQLNYLAFLDIQVTLFCSAESK